MCGNREERVWNERIKRGSLLRGQKIEEESENAMSGNRRNKQWEQRKCNKEQHDPITKRKIGMRERERNSEMRQKVMSETMG